VHKLTGTNSLVEINRRKGDSLEFHRVFQKLQETIMAKCKGAPAA
jgi:hypothetical protein